MTDMVGMDVVGVRNTAHQLQIRARQIETLGASVTGTVDQLKAQWRGQDAAALAGLWDGQHRPALVQLAEAIDGLAQSARRNANEQEQGSGTSAGGPASGSAGSAALSSTASSAPPAGASDLYVNIRGMSASDDGVRIVRVTDHLGIDRYIVYLDGTQGLFTEQRSWIDNFKGINDIHGATESYIRDRMSTIPSGSDVILVGYSQGGIHAENLAASGDFHVTDVVTFGSPDVPGSTPNLYGANVVRIADPRDPVSHANLGMVGPAGLAQDIYALGNRREMGSDGTFWGWSSMSHGDAPDVRVHTDKATYIEIGRQYDLGDDPRFAVAKASQAQYFAGAVTYDSSVDGAQGRGGGGGW